MIENIVPNPTSSKITITLKIPAGYHNDGMIEIFDALGNRVQSEELVAPTESRSYSVIQRIIELQGASGLRLIRVRTPHSISSELVYLLR